MEKMQLLFTGIIIGVGITFIAVGIGKVVETHELERKADIQPLTTPTPEISPKVSTVVSEFTKHLEEKEKWAIDDGNVNATLVLENEPEDIREAKIKYAVSLGWRVSSRSTVLDWVVMTKSVREKSGIVEGFEAATKNNSQKRP